MFACNNTKRPYMMSCQTTYQKLRQFQQENQQLKHEITKLTRTLTRYQNPNTPPSMRLYKTKQTTTNIKPKNQKRYTPDATKDTKAQQDKNKKHPTS
jgi:hypothetical protein